MYSEMKKNKKSLFQGKLFHRRTKRLLNDNEREFEKYLNSFLIFSLVFLFIGIVIAVWTSCPTRMSSILISLSLLASSILYFVFFLRRRSFSFYRFSLFYSIIGLVLSLFFCFTSSLEIQRYCSLLGIYFILMSSEQLMETFYLFRAHDHNFVFLLVASFLSIFIGILSWINPFEHLMIQEVLGIFIILYHVLHLTELAYLRNHISFFVASFD